MYWFALDEPCTLQVFIRDPERLGFRFREDEHHLHACNFKDTARVEFEFLAFANCQIVDFNAVAAVDEDHPAGGVAVEEDLGVQAGNKLIRSNINMDPAWLCVLGR